MEKSIQDKESKKLLRTAISAGVYVVGATLSFSALTADVARQVFQEGAKIDASFLSDPLFLAGLATSIVGGADTVRAFGEHVFNSHQ